jgi:hypothetical protein
MSIPGLSFIMYYLHIIKEPIWYVELRTVFGKENGMYVIGDSLKGRMLLTQEEFDERYTFEGFVMYVTKK